jgi:uncharacterized protein
MGETRIVRIRMGEREVLAQLDNSETADSIWQCLPAHATVNLWGKEIYFCLPVQCCETNMKDVVEKGDIGYWPPGEAMCIFFGPTPASRAEEIRPASKVHIFGKIIGDLSVLDHVPEGEKITLEKE